MNKRALRVFAGPARARSSLRIGALLVTLMWVSAMAGIHAETLSRSLSAQSPAVPFQWSGGAPKPWPCWIKPVAPGSAVPGPVLRTRPRPILSPARIQDLKRQEQVLRQQMWQLRLRRRTFLAEGRPQHAHEINQRLLSLGWRLRRIQAVVRAGRP